MSLVCSLSICASFSCLLSLLSRQAAASRIPLVYSFDVLSHIMTYHWSTLWTNCWPSLSRFHPTLSLPSECAVSPILELTLSRCSIIPLITWVYSLGVLQSHPNREFTLLMYWGYWCSTHNVSLLSRCAFRFTHNLGLLSPCVTVPPIPWVYSIHVLFNHPHLEFTLSMCYSIIHTSSLLSRCATVPSIHWVIVLI